MEKKNDFVIPIPVFNIIDKEKAQDDYDNVMMDIVDLKKIAVEIEKELTEPNQ